MTTLFPRSRLLGAVLAGLLMVACSSAMKESAQLAIADADKALQRVSTDGQKYAPDQYAIMSEQVTAMKAALDKQDYQTVLNTVHKVADSVKTLKSAVATKKYEARAVLDVQWSSMSRDVPKSLSAVEARVADIKKTHRLPKGVSKDALAGAGAEVDAAKQGWSDAQSAKTSGNVEDAVTKGKAAEAKVSALMTSLGMASGNAAAK